MDIATIVDVKSAAVILAAVIGASATFVVSLIQRRSAQRTSYRQDVRTTAAAVFEQLFVIQHAMEWATWHAAMQPERVDKDLLRSYEADVHKALPRVLGALARVAALNRDVFDLIMPDTQYIYWLEARVAVALAAAAQPNASSAQAVRQLADLKPECTALYQSMPLRLADVLASAQRLRGHDGARPVASESGPSDEVIAKSVTQGQNPTGPLVELNRRVRSFIVEAGAAITPSPDP